MTRNQTGNNKFLKEFNQAAILDLIRIHKAISKAEIAAITGLSPTATGIITASLIEKGYIRESGIGESKGGRRPVLLELKPKSFFTVGIDLDVNSVNLVLIDITGEILVEKCIKASETADFMKVAAMLEDSILATVGELGIAEDTLLGVGISVPGMVDSETHRIILAPNLGWQEVDLKGRLSRLRAVPVYVENEAMSSAVCENWLGACQGVNHFVCINVKSGIGAGIFTDGRLYRGAGGTAGEVGHIMVDENGPKCGCGNYGCLETMASTSRIAEQARKLVRQGIVSSLNAAEDADRIGIDDVVAAALAGDEPARGILTEAARYMGIAISNIVNTLNPAKIVLGKEFVKYAELVMDTIQEVVRCKALGHSASRVEIAASSIGEKASALGAAIIPLKILFGK